MIDAEGKYELGEVKDKEGIKPGPYKVRIFAQQGGTSDGKPLVFLIDPKFSNTETSGLSCEVKRGGRFDFTVERFKKK